MYRYLDVAIIIITRRQDTVTYNTQTMDEGTERDTENGWRTSEEVDFIRVVDQI